MAAGAGAVDSGIATTASRTVAGPVRRKRRAAPARPRRLSAGPRSAGTKLAGLISSADRTGAGSDAGGGPIGGSGAGGGAGPGGAGAGAGAGGGAVQGEPKLATSMSSIPTHSSWPIAFVVITRTWTSGWSSAVAGSVARTGVTSVASPGPDVASATKPSCAGLKLPAPPTRYCTATGWTASEVEDASTSRSVSRTPTPRWPRVSSDSSR